MLIKKIFCLFSLFLRGTAVRYQGRKLIFVFPSLWLKHCNLLGVDMRSYQQISVKKVKCRQIATKQQHNKQFFFCANSCNYFFIFFSIFLIRQISFMVILLKRFKLDMSFLLCCQKIKLRSIYFVSFDFSVCVLFSHKTDKVLVEKRIISNLGSRIGFWIWSESRNLSPIWLPCIPRHNVSLSLLWKLICLLKQQTDVVHINNAEK